MREYLKPVYNKFLSFVDLFVLFLMFYLIELSLTYLI